MSQTGRDLHSQAMPNSDISHAEFSLGLSFLDWPEDTHTVGLLGRVNGPAHSGCDTLLPQPAVHFVVYSLSCPSQGAFNTPSHRPFTQSVPTVS